MLDRIPLAMRFPRGPRRRKRGPPPDAILRALELVGVLLVGLVAGAWVDRLRRRRTMIVADLGRAVLVGSIPVAALAGVLDLGQLLGVAFLAAILSTFLTRLAGRS
jgi:hypothetical protein